MKLMHKGPWAPLETGGRSRSIRFTARFWEGPIEAGKIGRYFEQEQADTFFEQPRSNPDGSTYLHRSFLNTAASVNYHGELMRQTLK